MRKRFPGYFHPTRDEFDEMWEKGLIVPDANILLHLLRYGRDTRQQVLQTLRAFRPRVWIPYRVGFEFLRRWREVDAESRGAYAKLKKQIQDQGNSLTGLFNEFSRFKIIDCDTERTKIEAFITELCASIDEAEKCHPTLAEAEALLDDIAELIGDEIGMAPSNEEMADLIKNGQKRYDFKVPPGYLDAIKDGDDKFGDYLIWEEIISLAKARCSHVIFISDDRKDDWVLRQNGKDVGPRPELVQEFSDRTGQRFYNYSFLKFLEHAEVYARVEVSSEAIAEIEEEERRRKQGEQEEEARQEAQRVAELVLTPSTPSAGTAITSVGGGSSEHIARDAAAANLARLADALNGISVTKFARELAALNASLKSPGALTNVANIVRVASLAGLFPDPAMASAVKSISESLAAARSVTKFEQIMPTP